MLAGCNSQTQSPVVRKSSESDISLCTCKVPGKRDGLRHEAEVPDIWNLPNSVVSARAGKALACSWSD